MVSIQKIQKIADSKGLIFAYNDKEDAYTMLDKVTKDVIIIYANISIASITSEKVWREECNKLKSQAHR
jgi:hypothetical protein